MKPATTQSLTDTVPGNVIALVEGTVKVCRPPEQKEYQGKQYTEQWGVLTLPEGGECNVTVTGDQHVGKLVKGGYLRAVPGKDKKGALNGVKCKNYTSKKDGSLVLNVAINTFATLTVDSNGGAQQQQAPASTGSRNSTGFTVSTVEQRADDYFNVFCRVARAHKKSLDSLHEDDVAADMLVNLSPENVKDIATTILLSYKNGYEWRDPFFASKPEPVKQKAEEEDPFGGDDDIPL